MCKNFQFYQWVILLWLGLSAGFAQAATDCNQVTEIPVSECQSLLELYNSTNGANWTNNTGWNQTNTPCSWSGIRCEYGHVIEINLSANNVTGTLPDFNLPYLKNLNLYSNWIGGNIPDFKYLSNLESLDLSSNARLSGNIPNFSNLLNLQNLALSGNKLSGSIPNFSNLLKLQYLDLRGNKLSGSIPAFNRLPNLHTLVLNNNELNGSIPDFPNLFQLAILRLENNHLIGKIPNFSAVNLSNIWGFYLNNNCGLTAYDLAQEEVLNQKDPKWKTKNPNCPASSYNLILNKVGNGQISSSDTLIAGTTVNLTATPDVGYVFDKWSPSPCNSSFQMPANDLTCTATFSMCSYQITPSKVDYNYNENNGTLTVSTQNGCNFTAQSNASWINVTSQTTNAVNYSIQPNTTANARSGTVTIANQTFTINQSSNQPPIANFTIPSTTNTNANVLVDASSSSDSDGKIVEYKWTTSDGQSAVGQTVTFIFNKVVGSNMVTLTVKDNSGTTASKDQSITVTKLDCTFSLNTTVSPLLKATGDSGNFIVTPNLSDCPWSTISSETWITFSNSNGTGSGKVDYTILPNPNTQERNGTILVNNQIFTVKQAGKISVIPVAQFTASPKLGEIPLQVNLDASKSYDPDDLNRGDLVSYEWIAVRDDGKNQSSKQGKETSFLFDQEGVYLITLKVTDNEGQTAETTQTVNAGVSRAVFKTYRCANSDLNGFSGCQPTTEQNPFYQVGSKLKIALESQTATNRFERLDLWVAIQLPDGQFVFRTPFAFNPFKFHQPPHYNGEAFMPNVEFVNREDNVLEFDVPRNMSGKYTFYALYVALGKNPLLDGSSWKSNLAIKEITLE